MASLDITVCWSFSCILSLGSCNFKYVQQNFYLLQHDGTGTCTVIL